MTVAVYILFFYFNKINKIALCQWPLLYICFPPHSAPRKQSLPSLRLVSEFGTCNYNGLMVSIQLSEHLSFHNFARMPSIVHILERFMGCVFLLLQRLTCFCKTRVSMLGWFRTGWITEGYCRTANHAHSLKVSYYCHDHKGELKIYITPLCWFKNNFFFYYKN